MSSLLPFFATPTRGPEIRSAYETPVLTQLLPLDDINRPGCVELLDERLGGPFPHIQHATARVLTVNVLELLVPNVAAVLGCHRPL